MKTRLWVLPCVLCNPYQWCLQQGQHQQQKYLMHQESTFYLFLICKERTNMAVIGRSDSKQKVPLFHKYWYSGMKLADGNIFTFSRFSANLHLHLQKIHVYLPCTRRSYQDCQLQHSNAKNKMVDYLPCAGKSRWNCSSGHWKNMWRQCPCA